MTRHIISTAILLLLFASIALIGCSRDEPLRPAVPAAVDPPDKAAQSVVLVPDADLTQYVGWPAYPGDPAVAWSKIDEGVANLDVNDFIYAMDNGLIEILTFTDMPTSSDVDVSELEFVIPMNAGLDTALEIGFSLTYSIHGVEQGSQSWSCGQISGTPCGGDTLSFLFDDVCYSATEINTLQIELETFGTWWSPQMSQILITALDCVVRYDEVCDPQIQDLEVLRHGDNFAVQWGTPCDASAAVDWGYAPDALLNTATGGGGTSHTVNFTAAGDEGCVYLRARSVGGTCSGVADTSDVQLSIKEVAISDVVRSFDGWGCQVTTTWTTNVDSSSKVYWGTSPGNLTNTAIGAGNTTSHSVSFDATGIPARTRIYVKVESATGCDSAQSGTGTVTRQYCISR